MKVSRRVFLQKSMTSGVQAIGVLGAGAFISSCSQLDRVIVGDGADETQKVLILGAGASGLAAGYHLRKNDVPFRIFEASSRVGGRVLTLHDFNSSGQVAELGAEWFLPSHDLVSKYCKEFRLETTEVAQYSPNFRFYFAGTWLKVSDVNAELKKLQAYIYQRQAQKSLEDWDKISLEEFFFELKKVVPPWMILYLRRSTQQDWGADPTAVSTLFWMKTLSVPPTNNHFKISAGTGALIEAMYRRIAGVIPDSAIVFNHELKKIKNKGPHFELIFGTPKGEYAIKAQVIISTLPFTTLRKVEGIENLGLTSTKLQAIQGLAYGTTTKMCLSYGQRFWKGLNEPFAVFGDIDSQSIRETSVQKAALNALKGVLSIQVGGHNGLEGGPHLQSVLEKDLQKIKLTNPIGVEAMQVHNWSKNRYSFGSQAYYMPNQFLTWSEVIPTSELEGKILFAGEHTSQKYKGTLNGAFESGLRAANQAMVSRSRWVKAKA